MLAAIIATSLLLVKTLGGGGGANLFEWREEPVNRTVSVTALDWRSLLNKNLGVHDQHPVGADAKRVDVD